MKKKGNDKWVESSREGSREVETAVEGGNAKAEVGGQGKMQLKQA